MIPTHGTRFAAEMKRVAAAEKLTLAQAYSVVARRRPDLYAEANPPIALSAQEDAERGDDLYMAGVAKVLVEQTGWTLREAQRVLRCQMHGNRSDLTAAQSTAATKAEDEYSRRQNEAGKPGNSSLIQGVQLSRLRDARIRALERRLRDSGTPPKTPPKRAA